MDTRDHSEKKPQESLDSFPMQGDEVLVGSSEQLPNEKNSDEGETTTHVKNKMEEGGNVGDKILLPPGKFGSVGKIGGCLWCFIFFIYPGFLYIFDDI